MFGSRSISRSFLPFLTLFLALVAAPVLADWQAGLDALKAGRTAEAESHFRAVAEAQPDWYGGHRRPRSAP